MAITRLAEGIFYNIMEYFRPNLAQFDPDTGRQKTNLGSHEIKKGSETYEVQGDERGPIVEFSQSSIEKLPPITDEKGISVWGNDITSETCYYLNFGVKWLGICRIKHTKPHRVNFFREKRFTKCSSEECYEFHWPKNRDEILDRIKE